MFEILEHLPYNQEIPQPQTADKSSKHLIWDHLRPASETPLGWHFVDGPTVAQFYVLTGYQLYFPGCEFPFSSPVRIHRKSDVGSDGVRRVAEIQIFEKKLTSSS